VRWVGDWKTERPLEGDSKRSWRNAVIGLSSRKAVKWETSCFVEKLRKCDLHVWGECWC
jgi:hypothetical protein